MASNELNVKIGADIDNLIGELNKAKKELSSFSNDVDSFSKKLQRTGEKMKSIGSAMSKYITLPLLALGGAALKTAGDFEKLETSLRTSFNGNAEAARKAFKVITDFAAKTPFQVSQVADAFIKLKNLGLDPSEKALTAYGNTASAMGKSLNQMIEAVADASTGEFERLKEFGIRASKQGDQVSFTFKGVTKTVKMESAAIEGYLMNIGQTDFAGGMEAQSKTFLGRLSTLKDSVSLLLKDFGDIMMRYVNPVIDTISDLVRKFGELSPETKELIIVITAFAAAIGPLLIGLGFLSTTIIPALITGFGVLLSPITLVVAAIIALAAVVYKNFDSIINKVSEFYNSFVDVYNQSIILRGVIAAIGLAFKTVWIAAKLAFNNIWSLLTVFGRNIMDLFSGIGKVIAGALTFKASKIKEGLSGIKNSLSKGFSELTGELKSNATKAGEELAKATVEAMDSTLGGHLEHKTPEQLKEGLSNMAENVGEFAKGIGAKISNALGLGLSGDGGEEGETGGVAKAVKTQADGVVTELNNLNDQASEIINNGLSNTFNSMIDAMAGALASGGNVIKAGGSSMLSSLGRLLIDLGKMTLGVGKAIAAVKLSLSSLNPAAAIGAGIALLAIGAAFSAGASKLSGGGGGSLSIPTDDLSGSTGKSPFSGSNQSFSGGSNSLQNVVFEIQGTKLVGVLSNTLARNRSLNGTTLSFN